MRYDDMKNKIMWEEEPDGYIKGLKPYEDNMKIHILNNGVFNVADYIIKIEDENKRLKEKIAQMEIDNMY